MASNIPQIFYVKFSFLIQASVGICHCLKPIFVVLIEWVILSQIPTTDSIIVTQFYSFGSGGIILQCLG